PKSSGATNSKASMSSADPAQSARADAMEAAAMNAKVAEETPKPTVIPNSEATTQRESTLNRLQEETQTKYVTAINELQMIKINKDIAEANQAIATAKLSVVQSQKKIVDT